MTAPLLHEDVSALTELRPTGRRRIDPAAERRYLVEMRNDFLTPSGAPYKWQELSASVDRAVVAGGVPTAVPVRYRWERVRARTGTPKGGTDWRDWTFARGQSFGSTLLHTDAEGDAAPPDAAAEPPPYMDIAYPELPKSPAVDLLLMLSWDVATFELFCTHVTTAPALREAGDRAELHGITGSRARFSFSDPATAAEFHHAEPVHAEHLGYGRHAGRPTALYALSCLDCPLEVRSGPLSQRGRSSYWVRLQVDLETGDLVSADMTEMIIAVVRGADRERIPVQKRRLVRLRVPAAAGPPTAAGSPEAAGNVDPATLAEAIRLVERAAQYLSWQVVVLQTLPAGAAEAALISFQTVVGMDPAEANHAVKPLTAGLLAVADGVPGADLALRAALPGHRRHLEGLLAFCRLAVDGANRHPTLDDPGREQARSQLDSVGTDLAALLSLFDLLERRRPGDAPAGGPHTPKEES